MFDFREYLSYVRNHWINPIFFIMCFYPIWENWSHLLSMLRFFLPHPTIYPQYFFSHGFWWDFRCDENSHHSTIGFWYLRDNFRKTRTMRAFRLVIGSSATDLDLRMCTRIAIKKSSMQNEEIRHVCLQYICIFTFAPPITGNAHNAKRFYKHRSC